VLYFFIGAPAIVGGFLIIFKKNASIISHWAPTKTVHLTETQKCIHRW